MGMVEDLLGHMILASPKILNEEEGDDDFLVIDKMDCSHVETNVGEFKWQDPAASIAQTSCPPTELVDPQAYRLVRVPKILPGADPVRVAMLAVVLYVDVVQSSPTMDVLPTSSSIKDAPPPPQKDGHPTSPTKIDVQPGSPPKTDALPPPPSEEHKL